MTSVNPRQQTAYTPEYQASSQSAPARDERGAEAPGQADTQSSSAPARAPMTPEQRGQLSTHRNIMNQPSEASSSSPLAQLKQENQELFEKTLKLSQNVAPKIQALYREIDSLSKQLSAKEESTGKASPATVAGPQSAGTDGQNVAPSENSPQQDPVSTQPSQTASFSQAVKEHSALHEQIKDFFTKLSTALDKLQEQVKNLIAQMTGKDTSKTEEATDGKGTDGTPASDEAKSDPSTSTSTDRSTAPYKTLASNETQSTESSTPTPTDQSTKADESAAPSVQTIEQLKQQNQLMRETIEAQEKSFNETISSLEQQVAELTKQLSAQPK
ncbi:hypothetical protein [Pseudomonas sp.]|uniref:hypothetical protein n=1 Tax=Pseudomonas sp. TaxID=306 RepID=UPI003C58BEF8